MRPRLTSAALAALLLLLLPSACDRTGARSDPSTSVTTPPASPSPKASAASTKPPSSASAVVGSVDASPSAIVGSVAPKPGCDAVVPAADLCDGLTRLLDAMEPKFAGMLCPKDQTALTPVGFDACYVTKGEKPLAYDRSFTCIGGADIGQRVAQHKLRTDAVDHCLSAATWKREPDHWYTATLDCTFTDEDDGPMETGKPPTSAVFRLRCERHPLAVDAGP